MVTDRSSETLRYYVWIISDADASEMIMNGLHEKICIAALNWWISHCQALLLSFPFSVFVQNDFVPTEGLDVGSLDGSYFGRTRSTQWPPLAGVSVSFGCEAGTILLIVLTFTGGCFCFTDSVARGKWISLVSSLLWISGPKQLLSTSSSEMHIPLTRSSLNPDLQECNEPKEPSLQS